MRDEFAVPLKVQGSVVRVRMVREGKTVVDFVVQFEAFVDDRFRPIVRYNGSHGYPHRDTLDWVGETIEKQWAPPGSTNNQVLTEAIHDVSVNAERYIAEFLRRRR